VDSENCTGCGSCVESCPTKAIRLSDRHNWAIVCDTCLGESACAKICPTHAITLQD
jgi:Fe-S-cluster-containing hydrogenase component 2